jgi:hypothetical protein
MTGFLAKQAILDKAIAIATSNGWTPTEETNWGHTDVGLTDAPIIIFNHDFAKALWGESKPIDIGRRDAGGYKTFGQPMSIGWQEHLRDMVIADDPIKYLGDHLPPLPAK